MGLTPFEILKTPFDEVMQIYVDCILHDKREKQNGPREEVEWVTSKNATWH